MTWPNSLPLSAHFDGVVMLTWSNWHTELRSNRYHYATRFAKHLPVIFVQPDLEEADFQFEPTEIDNLVLLHLYNCYVPQQINLLRQALQSRGMIRSLFWIYNFLFTDFIRQSYAPLKIYHATEDYFSAELKIGHTPENKQELLGKLRQVLSQVDLLVTVSDGVKDSYIENGPYNGECVVLPNGCDFNFWAPKGEEVEHFNSQSNGKKVVFYQGAINGKVDFALVNTVIKSMRDWEFWFCGEVQTNFEEWKALNRHRNLKYLGKLSPEQVRELAYQSTVGIIPFVQSELFIEKSLPLKAFEYLACGLPVVTVPIKSLLPFPEVFEFAHSAPEFMEGIQQAASTRYEPASLNTRLAIANEQDYDKRFEVLTATIDSLLATRTPNPSPLNILILYDDWATHINTIMDYLNSFSSFSRHHIFYTVATRDVLAPDLSAFDVVILHYSVRICYDWHLSSSFKEALRNFGGFKILFIQDEYDETETARKWIENLGLHAVFTCVPEQYIDLVYPSSRFPGVEFVQILTGYVPPRYEISRPTKPLSERTFLIGYRGRPLPPWYGNLAREKLVIGQRMRQICAERGLAADIEWDHDKRIYGEKWEEFLENCKATLGTESGSNVFDDYGEIQKNIEAALKQNPDLSYEEIFNKYLAEHEGKVMMNQVSPKIFEAIAHKTALVLFEGFYSGVVKPHLHYIPLKKDFSNVDEVLEKLNDNAYLEELTNRAYSDVIQSGRYSYKKFVHDIDDFISQRVMRAKNPLLISGLIASQASLESKLQLNLSHSSLLRTIPTQLPLLAAQINESTPNLPPEAPDPIQTIEPVLLPATMEQLLITPTLGMVHIILFRVKQAAVKLLIRVPLLLWLARILYRTLKIPLRVIAKFLWRLRPTGQ